MTETADFWAGDFGKEYTERNKVEWRGRIPLFQRIIDETDAQAFLDVGCNAGWNMLALRSINSRYEISGIDVNFSALEKAIEHGFDAVEGRADSVVELFGPSSAQMVITSGVLIHIAPPDLQTTLKALIEVSSKYLLIIEYDAMEETEVEYRGHSGKLWKRPFGQLFEALGCSVLESGEAEGFDQCRYWLLEKP